MSEPLATALGVPVRAGDLATHATFTDCIPDVTAGALRALAAESGMFRGWQGRLQLRMYKRWRRRIRMARKRRRGWA